MKFRIVSYYTRATIYETIMQNYLLPCLNFFNLPNAIYAIEDTGKWEVNACFQPSIIWQAMKTWPEDCIVWMDSDLIIRMYPQLFNNIPERCDIGLYYRQFEDHYGGVPPGVEMPKPELNTGVMWFHNTPKMVEFVEEWMQKCAKDGGKNHRTHLTDLVNERIQKELSFFLLPRNYAYVAEREDGKLPAVPMSNPVIVQFTASIYGKKDLHDDTIFKEG